MRREGQGNEERGPRECGERAKGMRREGQGNEERGPRE